MRIRALPVLAAVLAAVAATPAAATGTTVVSGTGAFIPGLQAGPEPGYVKFTVAGTAVTTTGSGQVTCHVETFEVVGSYAGGVALTGTASCTGAVTVSSPACASQRSGMTLTLSCESATFGGTFQLTPTTINPINTYTVQGQMTFA